MTADGPRSRSRDDVREWLDQDPERTMEQAAHYLGLSRQRVSQILLQVRDPDHQSWLERRARLRWATQRRRRLEQELESLAEFSR